ncbi:rhodanese-like domain-containing protein [Lutibacter flavus]|uniref:Rhodanese-related sulfurtransferase n=1 Tax=Lutibacter flavus TaxID=691689 RepID=A0A238VA54_9FLAO|nr:rhodanese-like domain-containing protein [Lutibacter flavus]SNR30429.1 Rhodanese-related sulfurtransferase [Lutibacter flavus]
MKKISYLLIALFLVPTLFLTSCDKGDDTGVDATPAFTLMKDYVINNNLDIDKIITNTDGEKFVVGPPATAEDVPAYIAKYTILDIRSAEAFAAGHIEGAKNISFSNILTEGAAAAKPVLMVCYSGQTACYATALMRMYGYSHTKALKWGMSGWNSALASGWNAKIGAEEAKGHANWTTESAPTNLTFADPVFSTLSTDGATIFKNQVEKAVATGFKTASGTDVLNNPNNYFINNYFNATDYSSFGHVDGSYRILPLKLADNSYKGLDPASNAKVVTYCYTGQTSAVVTACLNVLGYDAYSLTYGMNGLYNTNTAWASNQWGGDSNPKDLPLAQ